VTEPIKIRAPIDPPPDWDPDWQDFDWDSDTEDWEDMDTLIDPKDSYEGHYSIPDETDS